MTELLSVLGVGIVVFASTNIDDAFLLAAFFADRELRPRTIVAGQFLGIGALVLTSTLAALLALTLPVGSTALLGAFPLALGVTKLRTLRRAASNDAREDAGRSIEARAGRSPLLAIAGVTVANGGDNLGVYIPLFASAPGAIPLYAVVFAVMTGLWCLAGHRLVTNRVVGDHVRRHGRMVLPFVLMALGLWILSGAHALLD